MPLFSAITAALSYFWVNFFDLAVAADLDCRMAVLGCDCRKLAFHHGALHPAAADADCGGLGEYDIFQRLPRCIITDYIQLVSRAVFLHIDRDVMDISCA